MKIWSNEKSNHVSFFIPIVSFIKLSKFISNIYIIQLYSIY